MKQRNAAAMLRSQGATRTRVVKPKRGKCAYSRKPKHAGRALDARSGLGLTPVH